MSTFEGKDRMYNSHGKCQCRLCKLIDLHLQILQLKISAELKLPLYYQRRENTFAEVYGLFAFNESNYQDIQDLFLFPEETEDRRKMKNRLYREILLSNDSIKKFMLGNFYLQEKRYTEAILWYSECSENFIPSKFFMASLYLEGNPIVKDELKGYNLMLEVANSHSLNQWCEKIIAEAQCIVGTICFYKNEIDLSIEWWTKSALAGFVRAQVILGYCYLNENNKNLSEAYYWHRLATIGGSIESQGVVGFMLCFGIGAKKDLEEGLQKLKEASIKGNLFASGIICQLYFYAGLFKSVMVESRKVEQTINKHKNLETFVKSRDCFLNSAKRGISIAFFFLAATIELNKYSADMDKDSFIKYYQMSREYDPELACRLRNDLKFIVWEL